MPNSVDDRSHRALYERHLHNFTINTSTK